MTEKFSNDPRFAAIEENLKIIRESIAFAAGLSGRSEGDVRLMAVTKTVEPIYINHALSLGIDLIGENKVQEFLSKKELLRLDGVQAHLIGHLQTNKVKQIVGDVSMIESVDSLRLAKAIADVSKSRGITTDVLIEVNIGGEESKTGLEPSMLPEVLDEISEMNGIFVRGLMTVPPFDEDISKTRNFFSKMHRLFVDIGAKKIDNVSMEILSMGMSADYEAAILEGANLVRVGSALFGARQY